MNLSSLGEEHERVCALDVGKGGVSTSFEEEVNCSIVVVVVYKS